MFSFSKQPILLIVFKVPVYLVLKGESMNRSMLSRFVKNLFIFELCDMKCDKTARLFDKYLAI